MGRSVLEGPARAIALLLLVAVAAAVVVLIVVRNGPAGTPEIATGKPVPNVAGTTLTGGSFDLAAVRGHPVVINFWGPTCPPCRDEMPLLAQKAAEHAGAGLVIVGVLTDDPVEHAQAFATEVGATWETVIDPGSAIKKAYRVLNRPQSYFVDGQGVLRAIQIGYLTDREFEAKFALIAGGG
jgi:cytochrome c biogenesis protein CcmG/thiol:disulfide interchange protein DsbE